MRVTLCHDPKEWNEGVLKLGGTLYHSWQWGEWQKAEGWIPWRAQVEDETGVRAATQVLERQTPLLPVCFMYAPRGILYSRGDVTALCELVGWARGLMKRRHAIFLRADPEILDSEQEPKDLLKDVGFRWLADQQWSLWALPRAVMVLDISASLEDLIGRMRRSHRYLIRSAEKKGCEVQIGGEPEDLRDFYELLIRTAQRQKFAVRGFSHFQHLGEKLLEEQGGAVFLARPQGQAVAGIVCAHFGKSAYYLYGGFDPAQKLNLNEFLHWKAIQWAKGAECQEYNFLGAGTRYPPQEGSYGYGLYHFKKGFGAELRYYGGYFDLVASPIGYRTFRYLESRLGGSAYRLLAKMTSKRRRTAGVK
jgi:lipid II:glycine glycyltransferase (peptidoglycan interpeptide bridge formation enzyme)